jgi:hypothetical protein
MEQLQVALAHLKAHRFWYCLGLAVLFSYLISGGAAAVQEDTKRLETALEGSFSAVKGYQSGDRANQQWQQAVAEKKGVLDKDFLSSHEKLYLEQEKLMTWPKEVAEAFKGRPFGAKLDDNQSKYIFDYRRACDDLSQIAQVFWELNVLDKQDDGKLFGIIDVGPSPSSALTSTIQFPVWSRDPNSMEAWYAQESLWIQRAFIKSIRKINRSTEESATGENGWLKAPVKRMYRIGIGASGLDQTTLAVKKELIEYPTGDPAAAAAPPTGGQAQDEQNVNPRRYVEKNDVYRLVPVSIHLLVDQAKITDVLTGLANTDFKFTQLEVRVNYPVEKVELPALLKEAGVSLPGRGAENPLYNCVDLDVYGTMRLYELPKELKERREKAATGEPAPAATQPEARPTETPAAPPPAAKDAKDAPKSEAKATGDAAKAAAPPVAEPPKGDAKTPPEKAKDEPKKEESKKKEEPKAASKEAPKDPTAGGGSADGKKKN